MAAIKALEGRTVHQIQSGQVIVDLCSVAKELVENSLDAGATSIEVRFKNNGLDSIEVQDNGVGISSENYERVALKHYTSKLTEYDDLTSLQTFGFRGEALSSLCALSEFRVVTAQADQAPKGTRLEFEISGKLKATSIVAAQKGTTVTINDLFLNLPVRRKELEKNIKREYGKVLSLLQAYACISTNARISASNLMPKGKKAVVFATHSNSTTRENIANVFGAKALLMLVSLDLHFDLEPADNRNSDADNLNVQVLGHVSKPVFGEGRNAPDRQMFFVNSRPCNLPQVAKVFNEVYKSYNVSQSPFVFANIVLDTNAYDVNVSPDKRTIMLHDQHILLESMRISLIDLFEKQDQTVPLMQKTIQKLPHSKALSISREGSKVDSVMLPDQNSLEATMENSGTDDEERESNVDSTPERETDRDPSEAIMPDLIARFAGRGTKDRVIEKTGARLSRNGGSLLPISEQRAEDNSKRQNGHLPESKELEQHDSVTQLSATKAVPALEPVADPDNILIDKNSRNEDRPRESHGSAEHADVSKEDYEHATSQRNIGSSHGVVANAFERMRPRRRSPEMATITIGSKVTSTVLGPSVFKRRRMQSQSPPISLTNSPEPESSSISQTVSQRMQAFAAPGSGTVKVPYSNRNKVHAIPLQVDDTDSAAEHDSQQSISGSEDEIEAAKDRNESPVVERDEIGHQLTSSPAVAESDEEYVDEKEKKAREDIRVAELIRNAEMTESVPTVDKKRRAQQILKGVGNRDPTLDLVQTLDTSIESIRRQLANAESFIRSNLSNTAVSTSPAQLTDTLAPEERLTLTISKEDFASMHIIGQFNLGFILATRAGTDMLIIDQHACDEKYNFERLQSSTVVQNQRLVHPRRLELTAVDEEIILENNDALLKNGFQVEIDQSGSEPVGQRCKLLTLPMSREVTFDTSDLEELIAMLADTPPPPPTISSSSPTHIHIPRPSKVRRMFAMRACRSSVMIGRTLTMRQMQTLVRHMGEIDKPWNCPHGRPTMRHLCNLADWTANWKEGDGLAGIEEQVSEPAIDWARWIESVGASGSDEDGVDDDDDERDWGGKAASAIDEEYEKDDDDEEGGDEEGEEEQ